MSGLIAEDALAKRVKRSEVVRAVAELMACRVPSRAKKRQDYQDVQDGNHALILFILSALMIFG